MPFRPEAAMNQLVKPCRPLDIRQTPALNLFPGIKEHFPRHQQTIQLVLQFPRMIFDTSKQINQIPIDIVVDLQVRLTIFSEQYPPGTAEYLYVPVVSARLWELLNNFVPQ